ncbi:MAG: tetratricopeptide repeat protein [Armatimonadota bacterium]|jgi:Tfp pilus assembly protein PilF
MHGTTPGARPGAGNLIDAGTKALNDNRLAEAVTHLGEAARVEPSNGQVWTMLGMAYLRHGMPNEALSTLTSAVRLRPSNATSRYFLGLAYQRTGNVAGAAEQLRFALQIDPNYHEARQALGDLGAQAMRAPAPAMGPRPGPHGPAAGNVAAQTQPMASQPGDEHAAMLMEQAEIQAEQRRASAARLRRGLIAFGACTVAVVVLAAVSIPLLIRSSRGSPTQAVRQYIDAKYVRNDEEAARRLTVEGRMPGDAFSELADLMSQDFMSVSELRSYVVGQPTVHGNYAEVPVEVDYVDSHGDVHRETVNFVTVVSGPQWRVSLLQSMGAAGGGGGSFTPPPDVPGGFPNPFPSAGG